MRKEDKSTIIEQIAATVKEYGHFYLIDTTAMNAADTSALRALCFKADIKLMVVKNTSVSYTHLTLPTKLEV